MLNRTLRLLLGLLLAVSLSGCSQMYDAWFANPCPHSVEVVTHTSIDADVAIATVTVPSLRSVEVKQAFTDAAGFDWAMTVDGNEPVPVDWERFKRERGTVIVPASSCRRDIGADT